MRSTATLFKTLLTLEKRVTKTPSKIAYYTSQIFKALLCAFLSFLIIQVEEKNIENINVTVDIFLFVIFLLACIGSLAKYVSKAGISLKKINHFPVGKKEIYYSYLLSDLLSFRNFAYLIMLGIIFRFLILWYGYFAIFSILFLIAFFVSILIWIRNLIIFFDNFFSQRKIKNTLGFILVFVIAVIIVLSYVGERMDLDSNPQKIIAAFSYLPFGWAGNGIIGLISQSIGQALLNLLFLLIFALVGIKIGLLLIRRKKFGY